MWIDDENVDDAVQHAERLMHYARIQKNTVITERQPEPHALQPTHSRQSVLIVDDSAMNRMLLSQMLNSQFDTAEAASGGGLPAPAGTEPHRHLRCAAGYPHDRH